MPELPPSEGTFKALTIDGGGIKGLYSALLLAHLEDKYGGRIADYFDLLCGTSTGGLIALALSLRIPAREIAEFYRDKAGVIFPKRGWARSTLRHLVGPGKYGQDGLRSALTERFGDHVLGDSECLLCIPSYSLTGDRPWIFKYDHECLEGRDNRTPYVDVALATSAAPTFFPVVTMATHGGHRFIDGGVYANNPVVIALVEALTHFVGDDKPYDCVEVLSVPSVEELSGQRPDRANALSVWDWKNALTAPFMRGQAHIAHFLMDQFDKHALLPVSYHRMRPPALSPEQATIVGLDRADRASVDLLWALGEDQGFQQRSDPQVSRFSRL